MYHDDRVGQRASSREVNRKPFVTTGLHVVGLGTKQDKRIGVVHCPIIIDDDDIGISDVIDIDDGRAEAGVGDDHLAIVGPCRTNHNLLADRSSKRRSMHNQEVGLVAISLGWQPLIKIDVDIPATWCVIGVGCDFQRINQFIADYVQLRDGIEQESGQRAVDINRSLVLTVAIASHVTA